MAGINKGDSPVSRITVGDNDVSGVYKGDTLIWQGDVQYSDPFWDDVLFLIPADNPSTSTTPDLTVKKPIGATAVTAYTANGNSGNNVVNALIDGYNGIHVGKRALRGSTRTAGILYMAGTNIIFPSSTEFTIEFWLYFAGTTIGEGGNNSGAQNISFPFQCTSVTSTALNSGMYRLVSRGITGSASNPPRSYFTPPGASEETNATVNNDPATVVGQWQHHAIVRDANNVIKYYINGTPPTVSTPTNTQVLGTSAIYPTFGTFFNSSWRQYGCNAIVRQIRFTKAARYTAAFTPYQRFYYPGIA